MQGLHVVKVAEVVQLVVVGPLQVYNTETQTRNMDNPIVIVAFYLAIAEAMSALNCFSGFASLRIILNLCLYNGDRYGDDQQEKNDSFHSDGVKADTWCSTVN